MEWEDSVFQVTLPPFLCLLPIPTPSRVVQDAGLSNEAHSLALASLRAQLDEAQAALKSSADAMETLKVCMGDMGAGLTMGAMWVGCPWGLG